MYVTKYALVFGMLSLNTKYHINYKRKMDIIHHTNYHNTKTTTLKVSVIYGNSVYTIPRPKCSILKLSKCWCIIPPRVCKLGAK